MTDNVHEQDKTDDRPAYDPPRALSLGEMGAGTGGSPPCTLPGSGAGGDCETGLLAESTCGGNGNNASVCGANGNFASFCALDGSGVPD